MVLTSERIFVNLPVQDLKRSIDFFTALGFEFNKQFTDDKAGCLVIGSNIFAMLVTEPFFRTFTSKPIADAAAATEAIIALSASSREQVDEVVSKALASGGSPANDKQDHGFMYTGSFHDPDGHMWEIMYMEPGAVEEA